MEMIGYILIIDTFIVLSGIGCVLLCCCIGGIWKDKLIKYGHKIFKNNGDTV